MTDSPDFEQPAETGRVYDKDSRYSGRKHPEQTTPGAGKAADSADTPATSQVAEQTGTGTATKSSAAGNESQPSSLFRPDEDSGGNESGKTKRKKGFLRRNRTALILGSTVGGGLIIVIGSLLFIYLSTLMIPTLAANITQYASARFLREAGDFHTNLIDQIIASDAIAKDADYNTLGTKMLGASAKTAKLWRAIRGVGSRGVNKAITNLQEQHNFQINIRRTLSGRDLVTGITLDDANFVPVKPKIRYMTPFFGRLFETADGFSLARQVRPRLGAALQLDNAGLYSRLRIGNLIRKSLGIKRIAWYTGKFLGRSEQKARLELAREKAAAIDQGPPPDNATTSEIQQADSAAEGAETADLGSDQKLGADLKNNGVSEQVKAAVWGPLKDSAFKTALKAANGLYTAFLYICTFLDSSLDRSGPTIAHQTAQAQRAYWYVGSAADQQKYGDPTEHLDPPVRFANEDLNADGQILTADAMVKAGGGNPDTSGERSAEASAGGQFTFADATIGGQFAAILDKAGSKICPFMTNTTVAIIGAIAQLVIVVFGPEDEAAPQAAGDAAKVVVQDQATTLVGDVIAKYASTKAAAKRVVQLLFGTLKSATTLAAITVFSREIVLARSGQLTSGLSEGNDLANLANQGAILYYGENLRQGYGGRPLTKDEVAASDVNDRTFLAQQNSQRSFTQRYFALSNTDSLLSKVAVSTYADLTSQHLPTLLSTLTARVLNPLNLSSMFSTLLGNKSVLAATVADSSALNYGDVQFGYSQEEIDRITNPSNPSYTSYQPLENQITLDGSSSYPPGENITLDSASSSYSGPNNQTILRSATIDGQPASDFLDHLYGVCFTAPISDLLTSTNPYYIVRDKHGNVLPDQGLCSPDNLGDHNPKYGDLVFRLRISMAYNTALDDLHSEANMD